MSFCYNINEEKLFGGQGHSLCGVGAHSLRGFSPGTWFPLMFQRCVCEVNWCVYTVPM